MGMTERQLDGEPAGATARYGTHCGRLRIGAGVIRGTSACAIARAAGVNIGRRRNG